MPDRRSYKEVLASLETHIIYINNHLGNIDGHLEKQNTAISINSKRIVKNSTNVKWIIRIGGGFLAGVVALALKLFGVY